MKYSKIVKGIFISRPNRFIANVEINGSVEICHVKNTGRCRELLIEGATVILEVNDNPSRKTKYDLIAVYKGDKLINIDSQAPNKLFGEWVLEGKMFNDVTYFKPECNYENSRFDFYLEANGVKTFVEVKGVTLERNGIVMFPDAPTLRGVKHLKELVHAVKCGYECYVVFVIQMSGSELFVPNCQTHMEFALALKDAVDKGVKIIAVDCSVNENEIKIQNHVNVDIQI